MRRALDAHVVAGDAPGGGHWAREAGGAKGGARRARVRAVHKREELRGLVIVADEQIQITIRIVVAEGNRDRAARAARQVHGRAKPAAAVARQQLVGLA